MILEFEYRTAYGKGRYYASNLPAKGLVELTGRKCLNLKELSKLRACGFVVSLIVYGKSVEVIDGTSEAFNE